MPRSLAPWLVAAALLLSACGAAPAASTAEPGLPQSGGTLRFAVGSDQGCVDPQQVGSNDTIYSLRQVVDSLTDQDPATGELRPWLATSWESNADATAYTFTLRDGVTFSDGTPLDAAAVKANFDAVPAASAPAARCPKGYLAGYAGTTVESPTRFTVAFDAPNVQFLQGTSTHSLGILSPATVAKSDDERCAAVIGSGPFVIESYVHDDSIVLAKRAGYGWGSSLWQQPGEAHLDRIEFRIVPESGVRVGQPVVRRGGRHRQHRAAGRGAAGDGRGAAAGPTQSRHPVRDHVQPRHPDRRRSRGAGGGVAGDRPCRGRQHRLHLADPAGHQRARLDDARATPTSPRCSPSTRRRAGAVLDAAGWLPGPDGIRAKAGQPLVVELTWFANAAANRPTVELIQQQLRRVGIDLQLREKPISENTPTLQSGQFDRGLGQPHPRRPGHPAQPVLDGRQQLLPAPARPARHAARRAGRAAGRGSPRRHRRAGAAAARAGAPHGPGRRADHGARRRGRRARRALFDASSRIQLHDAWTAQP